MTNARAIGIIENIGPHTDEDTHLSAWQHLIDNGIVWAVSAWHREAVSLITAGRCFDTHNIVGGNPHARV